MRTIHGYISDYTRNLSPEETYSRLPLHKKLLFKLLGVVMVEKVHVVTPEGVEGVAEVYLARCPNCGTIYVDYPHSYTHFIQCPRCKTRIYL